MSEIKKSTTKGGIEVSRVYTSEFQKEGGVTAELKQTVTTISSYPSKSVSNNLQDNIFGADEFGYASQDFKSERVDVAWINVPVGTTEAQVKAKLALAPKATLYRIVDNHPILSDNQVYGIAQGLTTKDAFAEKQLVRHGSDDSEGKWSKGDLVLDELGRPMYKAAFLSIDGKEDVNRCDENPMNYYASDTITAEMSGKVTVSASQTV